MKIKRGVLVLSLVLILMVGLFWRFSTKVETKSAKMTASATTSAQAKQLVFVPSAAVVAPKAAPALVKDTSDEPPPEYNNWPPDELGEISIEKLPTAKLIQTPSGNITYNVPANAPQLLHIMSRLMHPNSRCVVGILLRSHCSILINSSDGRS